MPENTFNPEIRLQLREEKKSPIWGSQGEIFSLVGAHMVQSKLQSIIIIIYNSFLFQTWSFLFSEKDPDIQLQLNYDTQINPET